MIALIGVPEEIPPGVPYVEWINTLDGWLYLQLPDGPLLPIYPGGRLQVARAELARVPHIAAWLEGLELRGGEQSAMRAGLSAQEDDPRDVLESEEATPQEDTEIVITQ